MNSVLYIHGFASSSKSLKAQQTKHWFEQHHPEIKLMIPDLSVHPIEAYEQLTELYQSAPNVAVMGSSLGGFYATALHQQFGCPAVLINPGVRPADRLVGYIGENQFWHSGQSFTFTEDDVFALRNLEVETDRFPERLWLMVQTHDETLDFKQATKRYCLSKNTIEFGGDHSFRNFDRFLPRIYNFFESFA
jgi:hypothetical protein